MHMLKAGRSVKEYTELAWKIPENDNANRYFALVHGVGMTGQYAGVVHREDIDSLGCGGVFEAGMTIGLESDSGHEEDGEGVKLEEPPHIDENSIERLSDYPFDPRLMPH